MATRKDGPFGRFYHVNGQDYPSVTHVLQVIAKPALIAWAANEERTLCVDAAVKVYRHAVTGRPPPVSPEAFRTALHDEIGDTRAHKRQLAKAGDIGSQVHRLIEWRLRKELNLPVGAEPVVGDEARQAVTAWEAWAKEVRLKPVLVEQTVYSDEHGYAGTMDCLAWVKDVLTLVDMKTGKAVYGEAHLQNAAYQLALSEMGEWHPQAGMILRLPKSQDDPAFEPVPCPPAGELFPVFLHALGLWHWWYAQDEAWRQKRKAQGAS